MKALANLKLKTKLIVLALAPLVGLLYFSTNALWQQWRQVSEMQLLDGLSQLSVTIGRMVHEAQKERGLTSGFLGTKGTRFASALSAQRLETDKRVADLKTTLRGFDRRQYGSELGKSLDAASTKLSALQSHREAVSARRIDVGEGIGYYTDMIASFLNVTSHATRLSTDGAMVRRLTVYASFLQAKEYTGIERATLVRVFSTGRFNLEDYKAFLAALKAQETYLASFTMLASAEETALLQQILSGETIEEVARMRQIAIEKAGEGQFGVDPAYWFKTITDKIDRMQTVEETLADHLIALAGEINARARSAMILFLEIAVVILFATVGLNWVLSRYIKQDLAERKQAAEALRYAEAQFRGVVESIADAVILVDRHARIRLINYQTETLFGYTREELVGRPLEVLVPEHVRHRHSAKVASYFESPCVRPAMGLDLHGLRKDGSELPIDCSLSPLHTADGVFALATIRDITERKRTEQVRLKIYRLGALLSRSLELKEIYHAFAEAVRAIAAYDRIGVVTAEGESLVMALSVAEPPLSTYQGKAWHRRGETAVEWVMAQQTPHLVRDLTTEARFIDEVFIAQEGVRSTLIVPLLVGGSGVGAFVLDSRTPNAYEEQDAANLNLVAETLALAIHNARLLEEERQSAGELQATIEELKQAEAQLVQTERLRAMGELAAGVAHDFNNALTGVLGQAILIRTLLQADSTSTEPILEALDRQEQAVLDAAETVRRIREATRPRGCEAFAPVALREVVRTVVEITRPRWKDEAQRQGRTITVATELPAVPPILGHEAEIREALTNLLINAVDAMPSGGLVTISTRTARGAADTTPHTNEFVELSVTDTGVGMTEDVQARLFEPFFTTKGSRGSGLGLSMVQGIMHRHRGEIRVVSTPGNGTTIILRFPTAAAAVLEAAEVPSLEPSTLPRRPLKILVIDDVPELAQVCCDLLTAMGHEAEPADGGKAGLTRLQQQPFDLVMTDLGMPEFSGWDVATAVKALDPALPVILVTGWGHDVESNPLQGTGVDLVLAKPYTTATLRAVIDKAWALAQRSSG